MGRVIPIVFGQQIWSNAHISTGLFAGEDISQGTLIGVYAGEIITIEEAMQRGSYVISLLCQ